jgi:hypothetical protein
MSKVLPATDIAHILTSSASAPRIARSLLHATRARRWASDNIAITVLVPVG